MIPTPLALLLAVAQPAAQAQAPSRPPVTRYWQQRVAYEIRARLDEPTGVLAGTQRIAYVNHSPDTLTTFALHLYLNAFRPGSRWADADSAEGRRRFNDLADPDFAFNHVRDVRIMGERVEPIYPFAPDSTIVRFVLPRPLPPGDSLVAELAWDARPSTLPRRQGRRGRHFDFAQWYPRVVTYDRHGWNEHPLYPAGEFYGEFGTFLVELDLPADQVVGATGVPLCGDPGWAAANRRPDRPVVYRRDHYPGAERLLDPARPCGIRPVGGAATNGARPAPQTPGRKTIVWYAEDVHHFALSLDPDYRYEGGEHGGVAIHVLYQPGDERTWGNGVAVERTARALAWLEDLFGPYPWPQITTVHRIEGGGTEFPMMMHNGSADQGLIVHELGHNYVMGILANNEWREGWLDEGFTSFQTSWFFETQGGPDTYREDESFILGLDLDGYSEPTSLVSEAYRDFTTYNLMIYVRGELFFHQLRYVVGDEVMRRILRTYYDRWKLKHVDEEAFRAVAEEVSGRDLSTLFGQWLHSTDLYDYSVGRLEKARRGSGWLTRVEVVRKAPGRIPVEVMVVGERDTAVVRSAGLAEREWVTAATASEPERVVLDPRGRTHDSNMLNNRKRFGLNPPRSLVPPPGTEFYLHPYFSTRSRRDRLTVGLHPTLWYNDAGGVTLGIRSRDDYLGRFEQNVALVSYGTGWGADEGDGVPDGGVKKLDFVLRARNPVWLRAPNLSQTFEAFRVEGRFGARAAVEWARRAHLGFGPLRRLGASFLWVHPEDFRYLDRGYYEPVGTAEVQAQVGVQDRKGPWDLGLRALVGGGLAYAGEGLAVAAGRAVDPFYGRAMVEATARRSLGGGFGLAARGFAGVAGGKHEAAKQRQIYFAGADPLEQLHNPFLRSRGALFVTDDVHYHMPGGAGVRGADPRLSATGIAALGLELERSLLTRPRSGLFRRVAVAAFGDFAHSVGGGARGLAAEPIRFLGDAGLGLRAAHRIGQTELVTRFDFPLWVSRPALAAGGEPGDDRFEPRWVFAFQNAW
ncbi:MAG TPA: M1 family metallopeptidase [Gemmatimonadales bacterium]|nr:M1 family metallopeptidase [Gemmatimonadales bacterium]